MHDSNTSPSIPESPSIPAEAAGIGSPAAEVVVSTHVLVAEEQVHKLRELSRRTRVAQSEYLREAVDDLLEKYDRPEEA
ncbi:ribbon-helix-helix domain-containing protein [Aggregicoccus sp. 17bor-14]|uniref:ribbon-helix-helix domain-containing protein n=1 Tax=Myxococcaceae TaxID=31 RepID=UPI00129CAA64|nr:MULTISPECIES: ribbon-helix-helix domain-containing protein [Myxococcaceae]MBF5044209.1 ribbon-helix-helix domain-containing protein [Simulacricoccus sp. 17bor-14]MRI89959.1 ribbon-helix-helix domain-containing protein [Aggregicoccus sp. 17bor-14]